ncbi:MAG: hypothetical protein QOG79_5266 [Mycobacterium sp.]|nr:hypothetical protein [Mycobacterium sp.]MDT5288803.1 hypothetical protein [Mycobacterium sp.]MDT5302024.1 hypothetical protein [Mycobacterium sp.]
MTELLFSYGTLRQREVQLSTFGQMRDGHPDAIVGFDLDYVMITDPHVIATSGSDTTNARRRDQWFIRSTPPKGMECRVVIIELSGVARVRNVRATETR